jgi:hydrogenase-4 component F
MNFGILLWVALLLPLAGCGICLLLRRPERILSFVCFVVVCTGIVDVITAGVVFSKNTIFTCGGWFYVDALSAYHLIVMALVFCLSSIYGRHYFDKEIIEGVFTVKTARRYGALWLASLATMTLVLVSNNLGIMWVGMETTTLVTAFLICIRKDKASIEGMWKYLIICSVGIAFAFMGTLFVAASTYKLHDSFSGGILWTQLRTVAGSLDSKLMRIGFIFIFVGYGTKAGLSPMHTWLPDAHSEAPSPVSAIFSGFMLNAALYCIMRYTSLIGLVPGNTNLSRDLFLVFGTLSIIVAAAFIISQHSLKRLLAYHSVEHLGIIAIGMGMGPLGIFAALFHTLNHSICKSLGFFCAGRLGKIYGSYDMRGMTGALKLSPVWGGGLLGSLFALIGIAPFALFMSEFLIVKAAISKNLIWVLVIFIAGSCVIFAAALKHSINVVYGKPPMPDFKPQRTSFADTGIVVFSLGVLLVLGLWMPDSLNEILYRAANIIEATGTVVSIVK